jgi:hypothetical protein
MELLIPGLILVALMVWTSTRIKRNAAAAFEAETIETDDYILEKPDGFLHVLNDETDRDLLAYSKDYGPGDLKGDRKAIIEIRILPAATVDSRNEQLKTDNLIVNSIDSFLDGGERAVTFETETPGDPTTVSYYKLVTRGQRVFELRFTVLRDFADEFSEQRESVFRGFMAK